MDAAIHMSSFILPNCCLFTKCFQCGLITATMYAGIYGAKLNSRVQCGRILPLLDAVSISGFKVFQNISGLYAAKLYPSIGSS